jgi:arabinose-5-phosphate isomerase
VARPGFTTPPTKNPDERKELAEALDEDSCAAVDLLLATRGHLFVGGVGTAHAVALRLAHLLLCLGFPAVFIHPADSLHGGSGAVKAEDTLVLISEDGTTADVNIFAQIARQRGARIMALTRGRDSELAKFADAVVLVQMPYACDPLDTVATCSSLATEAVADAVCEETLCTMRQSGRSRYNRESDPARAI